MGQAALCAVGADITDKRPATWHAFGISQMRVVRSPLNLNIVPQLDSAPLRRGLRQKKRKLPEKLANRPNVMFSLMCACATMFNLWS